MTGFFPFFPTRSPQTGALRGTNASISSSGAATIMLAAPSLIGMPSDGISPTISFRHSSSDTQTAMTRQRCIPVHHHHDSSTAFFAFHFGYPSHHHPLLKFSSTPSTDNASSTMGDHSQSPPTKPIRRLQLQLPFFQGCKTSKGARLPRVPILQG